MYAVILAGGRGKRFWPVSTAGRPKQLIDITGEGSMLSVTYRRLSEFIPEENILILSSGDLKDSILSEITSMREENLFSEPVGRNTAPAIALSAVIIRKRAGDVPFLVCPADHLIADKGSFQNSATAAMELASRDEVLVTFGIKPSYPATGFGYIEASEEYCKIGDLKFLRTARFHEKPDEERAKHYYNSGSYYWNSGIFVWRPDVFLSALQEFLPEAYEIVDELAHAMERDELESLMDKIYPQMPSISVDYAIMEKADNVVTLPVDFGWNDVGSWDALYDIINTDDNENAVRGDHLAIDSRGNLIFNTDGFTALIGVEDVIVVKQGDSLLVCKRGMSQRVKEVVERLEKSNRDDLI